MTDLVRRDARPGNKVGRSLLGMRSVLSTSEGWCDDRQAEPRGHCGARPGGGGRHLSWPARRRGLRAGAAAGARSEEHTSELQSLMRNSYAVFCLKKKTSSKTKESHNAIS